MFIVIWGWKRLLTAVFVGLLAAAALPPLGLWPVLFVSFPVLVWLLDGVNAQNQGRQRLWPAFWTGWGFGFGYFAASLYWIGEAFLVEAEVFAWALPFAVTLMPAGLALFWGCGCALAMTAWQSGAMRTVALSASLALTEWLRGTILSGFPWNAPGYAVDGVQTVAQLASLTGLYGVTFFVVLWSCVPAALVNDGERRFQRVSDLACLALCGISLAATVGYGAYRLPGPGEGFRFHDGLMLRIVQPNIAQRDKWRLENRERIFQRYIDLTHSGPAARPGSGDRTITHVVWPESALPVLIGELPDLRSQISASLDGRPMFIMGAVTRTAGPGNATDYIVHNSVIAFSGDGAIAGEYHKQHLVPFGEYLPLARWLEPLGLRKLVTLPVGFSAGPGPVNLKLENTPSFAALVCYEAIFPGTAYGRGMRPEWLLNVTNDAWFGTSVGPYQHFAQARMRAIEEGLAMVRAANTGISAVIGPYGRIVRSLGLGETGVIDSKLPSALTATIYATYGNYVFFLLLGLAFFAVYGHFFHMAWRGEPAGRRIARPDQKGKLPGRE